MSSSPAPPSSSDRSRARPASTKVIYIMGAGRSGSTILGVTLGNCQGVVFAGELDKWLPRRGRPELEDEARLRFWSAVAERVDAEELYGFAAKRRLERSSALLRPHEWPARRRLRGPYRRIAAELFRAVAETAGASCVVDSSHYPLRARELQRAAGIELYLVFLVRDPQGVVASFARGDVAERSFGTLTTNAYLWLTHVLSLLVFLRQPRERRLLVRHERFLEDPPAVITELLELVGSNGAPPDISRLRTGSPFQGNRLVREELISLRVGTHRPQRVSLVTALLQLPLLAAIGRLRPTARGRRARA